MSWETKVLKHKILKILERMLTVLLNTQLQNFNSKRVYKLYKDNYFKRSTMFQQTSFFEP